MELSDPQVHGTYNGLILGLAAAGASFQDCIATMTINGDGITLPFDVDDPFFLKPFKVHYPRDWVFHLENWGVDQCLSIRQYRNSNLAAYVLEDLPWWVRLVGRMRGIRTDFVLTLGEGIPVPLISLTHSKRGWGSARRLYDLLQKDRQRFSDQTSSEEIENGWLVQVDEGRADAVIESGKVRERMQLVDDLMHNLWTATPPELARRMKFVEHLASDGMCLVRTKVMRGFTLGARVVPAVDIVVGRLQNLPSLDRVPPTADVYQYVETIVDAARCLLCEVHGQISHWHKLIEQFGTTDLNQIHDMTNGVVDADIAATISHVVRKVPDHRRWEMSHHQKLCSALTVALEQLTVKEIRENAEESLEKYSFKDDETQSASLH